MSDIVERLRMEMRGNRNADLVCEAADEIDDIRAENERLLARVTDLEEQVLRALGERLPPAGRTALGWREGMSDIVVRLREATKDKDNMPRMASERWLPVIMAVEAADELDRLRAEVERLLTENETIRMWGPEDVRRLADLQAENERLLARVTDLEEQVLRALGETG